MELESATTGKIFSALSKAQSMLTAAIKDSKVQMLTKSGHTKKWNFADLNSVIEACKEPFSQNGLCFFSRTISEGNQDFLIGTIGHESGEFVRTKVRLVSTMMSGMQGVGETITYARRYALLSLANLPCDDDDGMGNAGFKKNKDGNYVKEEEKSDPIKYISPDQINALNIRSGDLNGSKEEVLKFIYKKFDVEGIHQLKEEHYNEVLRIMEVAIKKKLEAKCQS